jgi:hypothetical protein
MLLLYIYNKLGKTANEVKGTPERAVIQPSRHPAGIFPNRDETTPHDVADAFLDNQLYYSV